MYKKQNYLVNLTRMADRLPYLHILDGRLQLKSRMNESQYILC